MVALNCLRFRRSPFLEDCAQIGEDAIDAAAEFRTGDILLYQNADLGSVFNLFALQSSFGHAGVVFELDPAEAEKLYPPDYQGYPPPADKRMARLSVFEAVEGRGVCLFPLEARLARCIKYNRYLAVRRQEGEISPAALAAAIEFIRLVNGRQLSVVTGRPSLACNVLRLYLPCVPLAPPPDYLHFSCSELVAEALLKLEILRSDSPMNSSSILPTAFTTSDGVPGQLRLEQFSMEGHRYRKEMLFLYPNAPYRVHLANVKQILVKLQRDKSTGDLRESAAKQAGGLQKPAAPKGRMYRRIMQAIELI